MFDFFSTFLGDSKKRADYSTFVEKLKQYLYLLYTFLHREQKAF